MGDSATISVPRPGHALQPRGQCGGAHIGDQAGRQDWVHRDEATCPVEELLRQDSGVRCAEHVHQMVGFDGAGDDLSGTFHRVLLCRLDLFKQGNHLIDVAHVSIPSPEPRHQPGRQALGR